MKIRDRIKELRRVKASEILPNPKNWRTHPQAQQDALRGVLAEVGIADALLCRDTPAGLMLIDGHMRADTSPDTEWPVLILDVDEAEADKLLATFDLWVESTEHKSWSTVWRINSHKDRNGDSTHGCAFPVELPARAIRACSVAGMVVFEPYGGSGTTLIAAEQLGRKCVITELEPKYCDVILNRWAKLTGKTPTLEDGTPFPVEVAGAAA